MDKFIYVYSRKTAIEDGILFDVTEFAREAWKNLGEDDQVIFSLGLHASICDLLGDSNALEKMPREYYLQVESLVRDYLLNRSLAEDDEKEFLSYNTYLAYKGKSSKVELFGVREDEGDRHIYTIMVRSDD